MIQLPEQGFVCPAELLSFEEALLDYAESHEHPGFLHFWTSQKYFVVLGYSKKREQEVHLANCERLDVPVLRRASGGGTVLQGPGCINYSLVLPMDADPEYGTISGANRAIMARQRLAAQNVSGRDVEIQGHTDLTIGELKFCGNAQRRKRRCLLFHGAFLLSMDLRVIEQTLQMPAQQPVYRGHRKHSDFLMNLPVPEDRLKEAIAEIWSAQSDVVPREIFSITQRLAAEKYSVDEWNQKW